jgi:hypothetical protein
MEIGRKSWVGSRKTRRRRTMTMVTRTNDFCATGKHVKEDWMWVEEDVEDLKRVFVKERTA